MPATPVCAQCSPLHMSGGAKELLEVVVGAREIGHLGAHEEAIPLEGNAIAAFAGPGTSRCHVQRTLAIPPVPSLHEPHIQSYFSWKMVLQAHEVRNEVVEERIQDREATSMQRRRWNLQKRGRARQKGPKLGKRGEYGRKEGMRFHTEKQACPRRRNSNHA